MKAGLKDKISRYVDFSYGYGSTATLGFKQQNDSSFPITLIPRCIDELVTKKYKIIFVLEKNLYDEKYNKILVEIKKGLFREVYDDFPDDVKSLIEYQIIHSTRGEKLK